MSFAFARVRQLDYFWAQLEEGPSLSVDARSPTTATPPTIASIDQESDDERQDARAICPCCLRGE